MISKLKILYVGINYKYFNPTNECLLDLLASISNLQYYGPGYVPDECLKAGIEEFSNQSGPYDLVVASKDLVYLSSPSNINNWVKRNAIHSSDSFLEASVQKNICEYLKINKLKTMISLLDVDLYSLPESFFKDLTDHGNYFLGFGVNAFDTDDPRLLNEPFIIKKIESNHVIGKHFKKFALENKDRLISFGHFVRDSEISMLPIDGRKFDACVPGVRYLRREEAFQTIKNLNDVSLLEDQKFVKKLLFKIPKNRYFLSKFIKYYNMSFKKQLVQSKSCVTDGGIINLTIRKFIEIPASGSLLICWPTRELIEMGFEHNKNAIFIDKSSDLDGIYQMLHNDKLKWQRIASQGRELVIQRHTLSARSKYLLVTLEKIINSKYQGIY